MKIELGKKAPDFTLTDDTGVSHTLSSYKGSLVLVYFYPKDSTPGCTQQACTIRDVYPLFEKLNITVLGISADNEASHKKFKDKYNLPFTLLADPDHKVCDMYGVWGKKKFMGREYDGIKRTSFLIDGNGVVVKIYEGVVPAAHAEEVLADVRALTKQK